MDQRRYPNTSSHPAKRRRRARAARRRRVHMLLSLAVMLLGVSLYQSRAAARDTQDAEPYPQAPAKTLPMTNIIQSTAIPPAKPEMPEVDISEDLPSTPELSVGDWNLLLVNPWNKIPADHSVTLTNPVRGHAVDQRAYPDLQRMMDDCRAAGLSPWICSSHRTWDKQVSLFENKISRLMAQGYSREAAESEAATVVAVPGTSEHQTGLALDIVDEGYQILDEKQEDTPVQQWLMEHSWEYGFILRYPNGSSDVTGIIYEPWHYRYVGREAAAAIYEQGITLEEYLAQPKQVSMADIAV